MGTHVLRRLHGALARAMPCCGSATVAAVIELAVLGLRDDDGACPRGAWPVDADNVLDFNSAFLLANIEAPLVRNEQALSLLWGVLPSLSPAMQVSGSCAAGFSTPVQWAIPRSQWGQPV